MITYLQMFEMLKEKLTEKAEIHFKLDNKISQDGSHNPREMDVYLKTQEEWRNAERKYTDFMTAIAERNIRPHDVAALN